MQKPSSSEPRLTSVEPPEDDMIDLGAILAVLWRKKWTVVIVALLAVCLGGYYTYVISKPLYTSRAVVILETNMASVVDLDSVVGGMTGDTAEINSELQIIQSRGLMAKVVAQLGLDDDPEFNIALQEPSPLGMLKAQLKGHMKTLLSLPSVDAEMPASLVAQIQQDAVISTLLSKVSVFNVPKSLVFEISVETESATKSALIADTIVDIYIMNQIEVKYEATEQATAWLSERVSALQIELESAETKERTFKSSTSLVSPEALRAQEFRLKEIRERKAEAEASEAALEARLDKLLAANTRVSRAAVSGTPQLQELLLLLDIRPDAAADFDTAFQRLVSLTKQDARRASLQVQALTQSAAEIDLELSKQGADLIKLQQVTREADAARLLYEYFLTRLKETSAQEGILQADSRSLSKAVVATRASAPRNSLILAMSGFLGLMAGMFLVLMGEFRRKVYRSAREIERNTGYRVLGEIPLFPERNRRKMLEYLKEKPSSVFAESIRNLRTSLMLSNAGKSPRVIMLTSAAPGEGKTITTMVLAQNFAGTGKKVLLIEGDARRRTLTAQLETKGKSGIVSVLSGETTAAEAIYHDDLLGCDVLISESSRINSADLFTSPIFQDLLEEMREIYDVILIDTPPALLVSDARIIALHADVVILAVKWNVTSVQEVEEAVRLFDTDNRILSGIILCQINKRNMRNYSYRDPKQNSEYYSN